MRQHVKRNIYYISQLAEPNSTEYNLTNQTKHTADDSKWFQNRLLEIMTPQQLSHKFNFITINIANGDSKLPLIETLSPLHDLIIIGGTFHNVYECLPWKSPLIPWLKTMRETGVPILGICGGHQAMAVACSGVVEQRTTGTAAGTLAIHLTDKGRVHPMFSKISASPRFHFGNSDHVTQVPVDATILATTPDSPAVAVDWSNYWWSCQYHPEATHTIFQHWIETNIITSQLEPYVASPSGTTLLFNFVNRTQGVPPFQMLLDQQILETDSNLQKILLDDDHFYDHLCLDLLFNQHRYHSTVWKQLISSNDFFMLAVSYINTNQIKEVKQNHEGMIHFRIQYKTALPEHLLATIQSFLSPTRKEARMVLEKIVHYCTTSIETHTERAIILFHRYCIEAGTKSPCCRFVLRTIRHLMTNKNYKIQKSSTQLERYVTIADATFVKTNIELAGGKRDKIIHTINGMQYDAMYILSQYVNSDNYSNEMFYVSPIFNQYHIQTKSLSIAASILNDKKKTEEKIKMTNIAMVLIAQLASYDGMDAMIFQWGSFCSKDHLDVFQQEQLDLEELEDGKHIKHSCDIVQTVCAILTKTTATENDNETKNETKNEPPTTTVSPLQRTAAHVLSKLGCYAAEFYINAKSGDEERRVLDLMDCWLFSLSLKDEKVICFTLKGLNAFFGKFNAEVDEDLEGDAFPVEKFFKVLFPLLVEDHSIGVVAQAYLLLCKMQRGLPSLEHVFLIIQTTSLLSTLVLSLKRLFNNDQEKVLLDETEMKQNSYDHSTSIESWLKIVFTLTHQAQSSSSKCNILKQLLDVPELYTSCFEIIKHLEIHFTLRSKALSVVRLVTEATSAFLQYNSSRRKAEIGYGMWNSMNVQKDHLFENAIKMILPLLEHPVKAIDMNDTILVEYIKTLDTLFNRHSNSKNQTMMLELLERNNGKTIMDKVLNNIEAQIDYNNFGSDIFHRQMMYKEFIAIGKHAKSIFETCYGKSKCNWETYTDEGSGKKYYYNLETKETTWVEPKNLAQGTLPEKLNRLERCLKDTLDRRVMTTNPLDALGMVNTPRD